MTFSRSTIEDVLRQRAEASQRENSTMRVQPSQVLLLLDRIESLSASAAERDR